MCFHNFVLSLTPTIRVDDTLQPLLLPHGPVISRTSMLEA